MNAPHVVPNGPKISTAAKVSLAVSAVLIVATFIGQATGLLPQPIYLDLSWLI